MSPTPSPVEERLRAAAYLNGLERDELRDRVEAAKALCRDDATGMPHPYYKILAPKTLASKILAALSPTEEETNLER